MKLKDYFNNVEQSTGSMTSSPAISSRPSVARDYVNSKQQQQHQQPHVLPPCRVCGDDGAGFHYGVNTCEACKGFFHRSLKVYSTYRCSGNGSCDLKKIKRQRSCQYCRYQKCVQVGMSKEAIKTGRYTSHKKTSDIMEVKRLQENMDLSETLNPDKSSPSDSYPMESSKVSLADKMESKTHISTFTQSPRSVASSWMDTHSPVSSEVYDYSVYSKLLSPPKSFPSHSDSAFTSPYSSDALMRSPETPLHSVASTPFKSDVLDILSPVATPENVISCDTGAEQKSRTQCDMIKCEFPQETISEIPSEAKSRNLPEISSQLQPEENCQFPPETNNQFPPQTKSRFPPETNSQFPPETNSQFPPETNNQFPPQTNSRFPPETNSRFPLDTNSWFPPETNSLFPPETNNQFPPETNNQFPPQTKSRFPQETNSRFPQETNSQFPPETNNQFPPQTKSRFPQETNSRFPQETNSPSPPAETTSMPCSSSYTPREAKNIYPPANHHLSPPSPLYRLTDSTDHQRTFTGADVESKNRTDNSSLSLVQSLVKSVFADKREAIQQIREGHKQYFSVLFQLDKRCDELKQQQKLHAEQCEDKIKIFGQMYFISDKEYDEIWATTGLDVDNRKLLLKNWETNCELLAYALIKFSKNLPCFTLLDLTTQADLIKSARPEVNILNSMSLFDTELKVGIWAGGTQYCHKEFGQFVNHDFFWSYTATCRRVQGLNLTPEERAVIKAIMVFSTDRDGINITSSLPSAVQWQLIECLEFLLAKRFARPNLALAKIIQCLTELRTVRQQAVDLLVSGFKFYKYSNVLGNPILKELLSDVLSLCGDPEEDFREYC